MFIIRNAPTVQTATEETNAIFLSDKGDIDSLRDLLIDACAHMLTATEIPLQGFSTATPSHDQDEEIFTEVADTESETYKRQRKILTKLANLNFPGGQELPEPEGSVLLRLMRRDRISTNLSSAAAPSSSSAEVASGMPSKKAATTHHSKKTSTLAPCPVSSTQRMKKTTASSAVGSASLTTPITARMQGARDSIQAKAKQSQMSDISAEEHMAAVGFDAQCEEDAKKRKAKKKEEE